MMSSLDYWFTHIKQLHQKRVELNLDRIDLVAKRLQLKKFPWPVITVAGTNGKGSTTKTLESIYQAAGYKTVLYTSPHLMQFNERIRINNQDITDAQLIKAFLQIEKARDGAVLSFFEFTTLAALYLFQQAQCDVMILEVGLGGRLDAVNIVDNDVAVVTSIALDHTEWLGDTLDSIGYEKASIARAGKPLICGEENPPASVEKTVLQKGGVLHQINQDFFYDASDAGLRCFGKNFFYELPTPHLKPQNMATAVAVIEALQSKIPVSAKYIAEGIKTTHWPGRFETVHAPFPCVFDVAHNPHAAEWLAKQYQQLPAIKNTIAVVGMLKDKLMVETVAVLRPLIKTWYVCSLTSENQERGSDGQVIASFLKAQGIEHCCVFENVSEAMQKLQQANCKGECDRALIFGSFYTVAAAKRCLEPI